MDQYTDFGVKVTKVDDVIVVVLSGEWDIFARDALHEVLSTHGTLGDVVIDARAASFFDSSALSEFVVFFKRVTRDGHRFELLIGNSNIQRLLEMTGLADVMLPSDDRLAYLQEHVPSNASTSTSGL